MVAKRWGEVVEGALEEERRIQGGVVEEEVWRPRRDISLTRDIRGVRVSPAAPWRIFQTNI